MAAKKKATKSAKDLPKGKLTAAQMGKVKGGMMKKISTSGSLGLSAADTCKETSDTGMMGCTG
jgi:hypothetical protein